MQRNPPLHSATGNMAGIASLNPPYLLHCGLAVLMHPTLLYLSADNHGLDPGPSRAGLDPHGKRKAAGQSRRFAAIREYLLVE